MEISIVEREGKTYTRFKITQKEMREAFIRRTVKRLKPIKENSRFVYFETEGDLLNEGRTINGKECGSIEI
mgnify:CR=1 FL=1|jgi:hypothetical protein|nr:MAG TPA: hypothetical protein [Caudoviricetes sp.]